MSKSSDGMTSLDTFEYHCVKPGRATGGRELDTPPKRPTRSMKRPKRARTSGSTAVGGFFLMLIFT